MSSIDLSRYEADLAAAEAEVKRLRAENAKLADTYRGDPAEDARELLRRGAASLAAAKGRVEAARVALQIAQKTGSPYGLLARDGHVLGTVAVAIPGGTQSGERTRLIEEALSTELTAAARELGVVLAAPAERYTRERPGRDAEGRTVLDVAGRAEGDVLMPAVSKAAKNTRGS
ncbi:hypothetical protein SOCE26_075610 [Sorangium cellulosum]|uniref:Uncharacterized protein n=1 Tax=Sorangium cellulosum TaxID=56 RepID=A0A2L0F397_SORCE|nr:hypothetical protein [Sorangium cellulosum]AUX46058.1 hypothetical protein SOCE26_075610 [Sorangium cellulosum]